MPVLKYLADTNSVSDYFKPGNPVKAWFQKHLGQIALRFIRPRCPICVSSVAICGQNPPARAGRAGLAGRIYIFFFAAVLCPSRGDFVVKMPDRRGRD